MPNGQYAMPVATLTKTKLNIQQTALVGIAAVATATLLGAFTAQFAVVATGGLRLAATTSTSCTNPANLACGKPVTYVAPKSVYYQQYTINRGFVESNVTDGNINTYGYASDQKMGYEINLQQPTDVNKIVITWKHWGFSPYTDGKRYMNDYYVYGLSNGKWTKLAGKTSAPNENTTTITLPTPVKIEKLRVTSGWGLQTNGQWGTSRFNRAGNWLGLLEVEAYGSIVQVDRRGSTVKLACPKGATIDDPCQWGYYVGFDNKRYAFPHITIAGVEDPYNGKVYDSWYPHGATTTIILATEMTQYPIAGNVLVRPGTNLVRIATDSHIYTISTDRRTLRPLNNPFVEGSPDVLAALYGPDWQSRVAVMPDQFYTSYTMGNDWVALNKHLDGTLIQYTGSSDIYLIDYGKKRLVTSSGFLVNRFDSRYVVTNVNPNTFIYPNGAPVNAYEPRFSTPAGPIPNAPAEGVCGDGIVNSVQEDCDGNDGVPSGYACATQCRLQAVLLPMLDVSFDPVVPAQNVVAGSKNQIFAYLKLDAKNSSQDIKVMQLDVAIATVSPAKPSLIVNWSIYDGTTELTTSNDPDSYPSSRTTAGQDATATFTLSTPLVVLSRTARTLTVKADVALVATSGALYVGCPSESGWHCVTAKGALSGSSATIHISPFTGNRQTFIAFGNLTITADSSTPSVRLLPANSNSLTVAVLKASAQDDNISITKMYLTANQVNGGGWDQVKKLYVYKGSTLLKEVTPTSSDGANKTTLIDFSTTPITVPKDGSVLLTFKVDTPDVNYERFTNARSFEGFQLKVNAAGDVVAKAYHGYEMPNHWKTVTAASGNRMYVVRSFPTVTTDDQLSDGVKSKTLSGGTTSGATLYRFKVSADSAGDIGLFRVSFLVSTSTATVTNMQLYTGGVLVATATTSNTAAVSANLSSGSTIQDFFLTTDGALPDAGFKNLLPPIESVISAGSSRTYELRGNISCLAVNCSGSGHSGSVSVQLLGDGAMASTAAVAASNSLASHRLVGSRILGKREVHLYECSLLWTDFWRTPTEEFASTTASNTEQWLNGYLVPTSNGGTLPATSSPAVYSR